MFDNDCVFHYSVRELSGQTVGLVLHSATGVNFSSPFPVEMIKKNAEISEPTAYNGTHNVTYYGFNFSKTVSDSPPI